MGTAQEGALHPAPAAMKERWFPAQDRAGRAQGGSSCPPRPSLPGPGDSHLGAEPREGADVGGANRGEKKGNIQPESQSLQIPSHQQEDGGTRSKATATHGARSPGLPAESRLFSFCGNPRKLSFWGPHVAPPEPCLHPLRTGRTSNSDSGASC